MSNDRRAYRRSVLTLLLVIALVPLLAAGFVAAVDPYYILGSPSLRGFNLVRPYYEPRVLIAKPYQVRRQRPEAVALGSSRVEVGMDPRHLGWTSRNVFNFALPASNSYTLMLAFAHAQKVSAPLKQAVAGLDFFAFNVNFPIGTQFSEKRLAPWVSEEFEAFVRGRHPILEGNHKGTESGSPSLHAPWDERLYLAANPDVAAAISRGDFKSGGEHYELAGRAEKREGASVPDGWDERGYLQVHPDVAAAIARGTFVSGYHHYLAAGRKERRLGGFAPADWNEERYLALNPDARVRMALGIYRSGFLHYASIGKQQGYVGGFAAGDLVEAMRLRWPEFDRRWFKAKELLSGLFSMDALYDAVGTVLRQSEPAQFDSAGMRVWHDHDGFMRNLGGNGAPLYVRLERGAWHPWLVPPTRQYCFGRPDGGIDTFEPFRFMLRRAHAEGTDLRLFITPNPTAVRRLFIALGLGERYEFWIKSLVRINEEEAARAGRRPLPLWDFSDPNSITAEPIPKPGDLTPMRWYWEFSHYRKETGDLILDRVLEYSDPAHLVPDDFGVRLTGENVETHLARTRAALDKWSTQNPELDAQIVAGAKGPKSLTKQAEATCW
jgi:hypothetical protein